VGVRRKLLATRSILVALALAISLAAMPRWAAAEGIEQRIAQFWARVDALGPSDLLTAADLGQWAILVFERDPGAGISVADFRASTAAMQAAFERAGVGVPPGTPKGADIEGRIARFWARVDALGPTDLLTAADLGLWALNVTDRDPSKRIRVDDFRAATAGMQTGLEAARGRPRPAAPPPTATARPSPTSTPAGPCTPTAITTTPGTGATQVGIATLQSATLTCDPPSGSTARLAAANRTIVFILDAAPTDANGDVTLTATTDASGTASVSWTRSNPGVDTIAVYPSELPAVRATATRTWTALTPAPTPAPTPSPTAALTALSYIVTGSEVGTDYTVELEKVEPVVEKRGRYTNPDELINGGYVDSAVREFRKTTSAGVWFLRVIVTRYNSPSGAIADFSALSRRNAQLTTVAVGDQSRGAEAAITYTSGRPGTRFEVFFRLGQNVHEVIGFSYANEMDRNFVIRIAQAQASRPVTTPVAASPTPTFAVATPRVTAAPTVAPTPAPVPVPIGPTTVTVGGLSFVKRVSGLVETYTETTMTTADVQRVYASSDADFAAVQSSFGVTLTSAAKMYVFATRSTMTHGLQTIFGFGASDAADRAASVAGLYSSLTDALALNWPLVKDQLPLTTIRHEATHLVIARTTGPTTWPPQWFHEGNARQEQFTVPGASWFALSERYTAVSKAINGTFPALSGLDSYWAGELDDYTVSAEAVRVLRADIGMAGITRLLTLMRSGQSFASAFQSVRGMSYASFDALLPSRITAGLAYPGLATAANTPEGSGLYVVAYGLTPYERVSYTVTGPGGQSQNSRSATKDGVVRWYYATLTPGTYQISLTTSSGRVISTTGAASGAFVDSLDATDPGTSGALMLEGDTHPAFPRD
jgi:hypothetical protein